MTFLGIGFNTKQMILFLPPDKVTKILEDLQQWIDKKNASKKEVQSILGKLNFISKCVRPGRLFVSRMLNYLRSFSSGSKRVVSQEFHKDVRWWLNYLSKFNGVRMIPPVVWCEPDSQLATDACLTGGGQFLPPHFFT